MPLQEISNTVRHANTQPDKQSGKATDAAVKKDGKKNRGAKVSAEVAPLPQVLKDDRVVSASTLSQDDPKPADHDEFFEQASSGDGLNTSWSCHLCNVHNMADKDEHALSTMHKSRVSSIRANDTTGTNLCFLVPQYSKERGFKLCPYSWTCRLSTTSALGQGRSSLAGLSEAFHQAAAFADASESDIEPKDEEETGKDTDFSKEIDRFSLVRQNEEDNDWTCSLCGIPNLQDHSVKQHCLGKKHTGAFQKLQSPPSLEEEDSIDKKEKAKAERLDYDNEIRKLAVEDERFSFVRLGVEALSWSCGLCNANCLQAKDIKPHCLGKKHAIAFEAWQMIGRSVSLIEEEVAASVQDEEPLKTSTPTATQRPSVDLIKETINEAEDEEEESHDSPLAGKGPEMYLEEFFASPVTKYEFFPVVDEKEESIGSDEDPTVAELLGEPYLNSTMEQDEMEQFSDKLGKEFDELCDAFMDQASLALKSGRKVLKIAIREEKTSQARQIIAIPEGQSSKARQCIADLAFCGTD